MPSQFFGYLSDTQTRTVHETSLEILEEVGLIVRNEKARHRFAEHGASVDHATELVKIPSETVEHYRAQIPSTITLRGRDPHYDVTFPRDYPVIATASSAPDIIDPVSGEARRSTSDDIANIARLVNELDGFDLFSISVLADDAPEDQFSLSRFYPALKNCVKPVRTSVIDKREVRQVLKLGELIAGDKDAFWERPFINFGYCAIVSPLTMDYDSTEMLMFYAENDITAYGTIAPMGGLSTPLTLAGMLALMNAEWLAAATLAQMSKPATSLLYNFLPVFADMRDGAYASGAIEIGMMNSAVCAMARFYDVPSGGYLGLTNSKVSDAQAGFEKGMSPLLGTVSGVDFIVMGGLLDALMTFDFGQVVIDNEIAQMLKRVRRGFEFSPETISLEEIKKVGPGGMYAGNPQTLERMTRVNLLPELADRKTREQWSVEGASTIHSRALDKALDILSAPTLHTIDENVDTRVRAAFDDLVAGESVLPEGWTRSLPPAPRRERRVNRRRRG